MPKTRIALIGLGMAVAPHAKSAVDLADRVEVAYAFSPSAERRAQLPQRFAFPQCERIKTILEDRSVDAVAILTPPATHLELARQFAEAGKHVLLEKPLDLTTARAEAIVAACRAAKVKLGIVLQNRHKPSAERLAALLRGGELGAIYGASTIIRLWRPQSYYDEPGRGTLARDGGGVLLTQAIHSLDLFRSLVGVTDVLAVDVRTTALHSMETEDYVAALLRLSGGASGTLMAT